MAGAVVEGQTLVGQLYRDRIKWIGALAGCVFVVSVSHAAWVLPGISPLRETYGWDKIAARAKAEREILLATRATQVKKLEDGGWRIEDRAGMLDSRSSILDPQFSPGPGPFYLAIGNRSYPCPSQLAFHLNAPELVHGSSLFGIRNLQYQYWSHPDELRGQDAVVVLESGINDAWVQGLVAAHFRSLEPAGELILSIGKLPFGRKRQVRYLFFRAHGYNGLP
jgi:hypothetical protein